MRSIHPWFIIESLGAQIRREEAFELPAPNVSTVVKIAKGLSRFKTLKVNEYKGTVVE